MNEPTSAATGWLYAAICAGLDEGLVKIGATTRQPLERMRQLSASTSTPSPFVLAYSKHVAFPFRAEANIHKKLDAYRTHNSREFFRIPLHMVIAEFDNYAERSQPYSGTEYPWAELFASFGEDDGSPRELKPAERLLCTELAATIASGKMLH